MNSRKGARAKQDMKSKLIIVIEGGVVQEVRSSEPLDVQVEILDLDGDGSEDRGIESMEDTLETEYPIVLL